MPFIYFNKVDPQQYWKFFIDSKYWNDPNGKYIFDRKYSPGYFRHCSMAFQWMLSTVENPVDLDYIIALRNIAYHDDPKNKRGLTVDNVSCGVGAASFTAKGLEQLIQQCCTASDSDDAFQPQYFLKHGEEPGATYNNFAYMDAESVEKTLNYVKESLEKKEHVGLKKRTPDPSMQRTVDIAHAYLKKYHEDIANAKSEDEKLFTIIQLVQNLHQFHLFHDGNGRTFCFFLLNRLLHDQGLKPAIVEDPGFFTGWSTQELVEVVKAGQIRFETICQEENQLSLVETIQGEINLTHAEKDHLLPSTQTLQLKTEALMQHAQDQMRIIECLQSVAPYWRVQIIENALKTLEQQQSSHQNELTTNINNLQQVLLRLRRLAWVGYDNNDKIFSATIKYGSFDEGTECYEEKTEELYQILQTLNALCHNATGEALLLQLLENTEHDAKETVAAIAKNIATWELNYPRWFDQEKYLAMLAKSAPNYFTFKPFQITQPGKKWRDGSIDLLRKNLYVTSSEHANIIYRLVYSYQSYIVEKNLPTLTTLFKDRLAEKSNLVNRDAEIQKLCDEIHRRPIKEARDFWEAFKKNPTEFLNHFSNKENETAELFHPDTEKIHEEKKPIEDHNKGFLP